MRLRKWGIIHLVNDKGLRTQNRGERPARAELVRSMKDDMGRFRLDARLPQEREKGGTCPDGIPDETASRRIRNAL
jgi:hypothetical protein